VSGTFGIAVRPADVTDVDALVAIANEVVAEGRWVTREPAGVPFARTDFSHERYAGGAMFVACDGKLVIGLIRITREDDGAYHFGMMVRGSHRRKGYGKALLEAAVAWARERCIDRLFLIVYSHNLAARELYRQSGFVEIKSLPRHCLRSNGETWDAVMMVRELTSTQ
jgi:ribosomal protein S18 acetylase RimI-like enzyme